MSKSNDFRILKAPKEFKKKIKIEAAKREMTMADLMRELAKDEEEVKKIRGKNDFFNL